MLLFEYLEYLYQWMLDMGQSFPFCLFTWLDWLARWLIPHKSCGLWSWDLALFLDLALYGLKFFFGIKVAAFYLLKALICIVFAPLAHQDFSFWWLRATWDTQLVCYCFWGLTHLCLSPQKVLSLINFLDYLAFADVFFMPLSPYC